MSDFTYCPDCWPADMGEFIDGHCAVCGARLATTTTPEQYITLLEEQVEALSTALQQAMEYIGSRKRKRMKPALRLVHVRRETTHD